MTPEEAEDPAEVFARFDGKRGMHVDPRQVPADLKEPAMDAGQPAEPGCDVAEQVRRGLDYIRTTYGGDAL
jgi:hypothetical protein